MRKLRTKLLFVLGLFTLLLAMFTGQQTVKAATNNFQYQTEKGQSLVHGKQDGENTFNYNYGGQTETGVQFDDEKYVNYDDQAYVRKTVKENATKQGLFDVSLAVKGNNLSYPVDVVLVMDYSSTMNGPQLDNAIKGVDEFLNEISDVMASGNVRVGMVAYNRNIYTTAKMPGAENGFLKDTDTINSFMRNVAKSNSGTFLQGGLLTGQRMLEEDPKAEARKILVHIGDGRANQSYQATTDALTPNNGQLVSANGKTVKEAYPTNFLENDARLISGSKVDPDVPSIVMENTNTITDNTLGTILNLKANTAIDCYSIVTLPDDSTPSARGQFIARNIASSAAKYRTINENLTGLSDALSGVASQIDNTVANGTVTDPMGQDILLQQAGATFNQNDYQLAAARKTGADWVEAPDLLKTVSVQANNGVITMSGLRLGKDERVILTYKVRINTESNDFQPDTWYLANGRTTLDLDVAYETVENLLDFPIPSIKAPGVSLNLSKQWTNENSLSKRPDAIDFIIRRQTNTSATAWQQSAQLSLNKANNWQTSISSVIPEGTTQSVNLPKYNNVGDNYQYSAEEINVPDGYESSVTTNGNQIVLTNKWTKELPEPDPEPTPDPEPEPKPDPDPSKPDPDSVKKETTEKTTNKKNDQAKLPQANEKSSQTTTVIGAIILIIVVILGGWWYKRRDKKNSK